jgi:hypothetical protein
LKVTYLHYFVALEQIIALLVDLVPDHVSILLFLARLEIMAPSWAISGGPAHLISSLALKKSMWSWIGLKRH